MFLFRSNMATYIFHRLIKNLSELGYLDFFKGAFISSSPLRFIIPYR